MSDIFSRTQALLGADALEKLKGLKKNNVITEDDEANGEKKIQNLTDRFCKEIDDLAGIKEKEILEI